MIIYLFPLLIDVVVGLLLFVGRHSLAQMGYNESVVGSIPMFYGFGYLAANMLMRYVVRIKYARVQMISAVVMLAMVCVLLANMSSLTAVRILFCIAPFTASLFFNAFQAFMLNMSTSNAKPLDTTIAHYTFAWSLGFAIGPFVSGIARNYGSWGQTYYIAAGAALLVAVIASLLRTKSTGVPVEQSPEKSAPENKKALAGPAWMGVLIGWGGWVIISTYWPIQAQQLHVSSFTKGMVEFLFACTQAFVALSLVNAGKWYHKPLLVPLAAIPGVIALIVFGFNSNGPVFMIGAVLYGIFTAVVLNNMVFQSMYEQSKAVKRVAVNEMIMGICFIGGPVVASLIHRGQQSFTNSYIILASIVAMAAIIQMFYVRVRNTVK